VRVLRKVNGWTAYLRDRAPKRSLPGDTPELVEALHALNRAGALLPNCLDDSRPAGRCPRCGRLTAIKHWYDIPSVCTGCRADGLVQVPAVVEWNQAAFARAHAERVCSCYGPGEPKFPCVVANAE
jgi:hypothetical protein